MVARVVIDQHACAGLHVARQDVPGRHDQFVALRQHLGMRQPARGDDDHVRRGAQHVGLVRECVEAEGDAQPLALLHPPRDDLFHLAPPGLQRGQADLPSGLVGGLEDGDGMAALGGDTSRLEARGTGPHDRHPAHLRGGRDRMGHRFLAPRGGVVDAKRHAPLVDAVEAVVRADAGADAVLLPGHQLSDDMRVGDMGAGHADHVQQPAGDGMAGGGDVLDARRMEGRHLRGGADLACEIQMRGRGHPLDRDQVGQPRVRVDMPAHDVQEIDLAAALQAAGDLGAVLLRDAARHLLVRDDPHAHDEVGADAVAHRVQHLEGEAQAVVEAAAIGRVQVVDRGRPELRQKLAVGLQLDPVHARLLHPLGGVGELGRDAGDVPVLDPLGKGAMRGLAFMRRPHDRQPVPPVPARAAAHVRDLDHHGRAVIVALVHQPPHPRHDLVLVKQQVPEGGRAVRPHHRRARRHRQRDPALGAFDVIGAIAVLGQPVLAIGRLVRGQQQAVPQRQVLEGEGLKQRIVRHGALSGRVSTAEWNHCSPLSRKSITPNI